MIIDILKQKDIVLQNGVAVSALWVGFFVMCLKKDEILSSRLNPVMKLFLSGAFCKQIGIL